MPEQPKVHVGSGVYAPASIEVDSRNLPHLNLEAHVSATLTLDGARYVVDKMRIERTQDGPPITSELIRKIPVQTLVRYGVAAAVDTVGIDGVEEGFLTGPLLDRVRSNGPTDETLALVAQVYTLAELQGVPPAKTVRNALGIPTATAGTWIRRAKDRGLLQSADAGTRSDG